MLFNFDIEDGDDTVLADATSSLTLAQEEESAGQSDTIAHKRVPLAELLATLPPLISYTPVKVNLTTSSPPSSTHLLRRDLFDARFQVLTQDEDAPEGTNSAADAQEAKDKGKQKEHFVDEDTDLIKGVYEGGLKTWECSLDLVDCLSGMGYGASLDGGVSQDAVRGKSILELGCGTALPTCSVFARLLQEIEANPSDPSVEQPPLTRIHLQDYNDQVLSLITLPNLLLTYGQHLASLSPRPVPADPERSATLTSITEDEENAEAAEVDDAPDADAGPQPGDLEIEPEFLESFEALLTRERIELVFFSGSWKGFEVDPKERYDLVLTSETVYSLPSLPPLLDLLQAASWPAQEKERKTDCLVACKRIYFGVGGGELEFRRRCEERGAKVQTTWGEREGQGGKGVGRVVMSVEW